MTNVIGYARVSRREQNPAAQEAELRAAGAIKVFVDHGESSRIAARPQWVACLDYLREGDTLLVRRLDRLGVGFMAGRSGPGRPQQQGNILVVAVLQGQAGLADAGSPIGGDGPVPQAARLDGGHFSPSQRRTALQSSPNRSRLRPTDWSTISRIDSGRA